MGVVLTEKGRGLKIFGALPAQILTLQKRTPLTKILDPPLNISMLESHAIQH